MEDCFIYFGYMYWVEQLDKFFSSKIIPEIFGSVNWSGNFKKGIILNENKNRRI